MDVQVAKYRSNVDRKKQWNLHTDLLAEVFSYLPQICLFEVMLVSRRWEKAVKEGTSSLWRKVTVVRWEQWCGERGKQHQMLSRLLRSAEEVHFVGHVGLKFPSSVSEVLGQKLIIIELPQNISTVTAAFLHTLLSNSPDLRWLLVKGEEPRGLDLLRISHQKLEVLELLCLEVRPLTVICPNLTHLSTIGDAGVRQDAYNLLPLFFITPTLHCPQLKSLYLSRLHCDKGVLESMAVHAPSIIRLFTYQTEYSHSMDATLFKSLRSLTLKGAVWAGYILAPPRKPSH